MSQKSLLRIIAVLGILGLSIAAPAFAGYGKKDKAQAEAPAAAAAPAAEQGKAEGQGMAMDEEMMAKWKEYSTPNENHQVLEPLVGNWEYSLKMWMAPDAPADESAGTSESKWILDGRFIEEITQGTWMGQPFNGQQVIGFDNAQKQYMSTWIDNMGTGMMSGAGTFDPATKTLTQTGSFMCPFKGKMPLRWVTKIIDNDNHVFEAYTNDDSGKEFKHMEIIYKKKS